MCARIFVKRAVMKATRQLVDTVGQYFRVASDQPTESRRFCYENIDAFVLPTELKRSGAPMKRRIAKPARCKII